MTRHQYTVKGVPYRTFDLKSEVTNLTERLQLPVKVHVRTLKTRFVIELHGDEEDLRTIEPHLLTTVTGLIDITFYSKKRYDETTRKFTDPQSSRNSTDSAEMRKQSMQLLSRGDVIAVKTENGYHILCHAAKSAAIKKLREITGEPTRPLPVLFKNLINLEKLVLVSRKEKDLLLSEERPFVMAKKRLLHRLERERYRYLLSPQINPLNQRVTVAVEGNDPFYRTFFSEHAFPLVTLDATTPEGEMIVDKAKLSEIYGDKLKYIFDTETEVTHPAPRSVYQIVYGEACRITPSPEERAPSDALKVVLDTAQTQIGTLKMKPLKILLDENGHMQPALTAMSLLFQKLPLEEIRGLDLPFSQSDLDRYCTRWKEENGIASVATLLVYFDAVTALCGESATKSFETESLLRCEGAFEVCEEELFDYTVGEEGIEIDLLSTFFHKRKFKTLASTLCNTISEIISENIPDDVTQVALTGELFTCRDLSELTIEKMKECGKEVHYC